MKGFLIYAQCSPIVTIPSLSSTSIIYLLVIYFVIIIQIAPILVRNTLSPDPPIDRKEVVFTVVVHLLYPPCNDILLPLEILPLPRARGWVSIFLLISSQKIYFFTIFLPRAKYLWECPYKDFQKCAILDRQ